jgi:hypothetical protein
MQRVLPPGAAAIRPHTLVGLTYADVCMLPPAAAAAAIRPHTLVA